MAESCEVCGEAGVLRQLDVNWRDGAHSKIGAWTETLCDQCIPAYVEWMKRLGHEVKVA